MTRPKPTEPARAHLEGEHPALMEALVQATEQVIAEHGPEGVTSIRIATRAGVSLATLLRCLRNKDALVAEAMARRSRAAARPVAPVVAPPIRRVRTPAAAAPPASRTPAPPPPPAAALFRTPAPPPPPASSLFRTPAPSRSSEPPQAPAISRRPTAPRSPPVAPSAPAETLEEAISAVMHQLVSSFAVLLPQIATMPTGDRDAINRVELKRVANACETMLARHSVPDPPHVAHVMTISCDKVVKDAIRHAPESFTDGRLEQALCRLCLDFVRSE